MVSLAIKIIDITSGGFANDVTVETRKIVDGNWVAVSKTATGQDGCATLSEHEDLQDGGYYEVTAFLGAYFNESGYALPQMKFVDIVPLRFGLEEVDEDCKIVLSVSPYGYNVVHT